MHPLSRVSAIAQLSYITLVTTTLALDLDVEWSLQTGSHYVLSTLHLLLGAVTPALLITSMVGQLDGDDAAHSVAKKNALRTLLLFLGACGATYYAYTRPDMQFFPLAGLLFYLFASGGLTLFQLGLLVTAKHPIKR